jgi:hypothetical protein
VVVFGRTPAKLHAFAEEFGYATTTDLASIYDDPAVDLVDVCLPTPVHAEHVLRALAVSKHVLCELHLATTMDDAINGGRPRPCGLGSWSASRSGRSAAGASAISSRASPDPSGGGRPRPSAGQRPTPRCQHGCMDPVASSRSADWQVRWRAAAVPAGSSAANRRTTWPVGSVSTVTPRSQSCWSVVGSGRMRPWAPVPTTR